MTSDDRIAQAKSELGETAIAPATAKLMVFAALAVAMVVPVVDQVRAFSAASRGDRLSTLLAKPLQAIARIPAQGLFTANREFITELGNFETTLETQSVARLALPFAQRALHDRFGYGNERVYVGHDGWLYFRAATDHVLGHGFLEASSSDPVAAIVDFGNALGDRGLQLLVVPAPAKASLAPEHLARAARAPIVNPSLAAFFDRLEARGVAVFDPTPVLVAAKAATGREQYLKTDTHWTPAAADQVAMALALRLRSELALPESGGCVESEAEDREIRDLAAMLPGVMLPPEPVNVRTVRHVGNQPARSADHSSPVLFLGDSFSNVYSEARGGGASSFPDRLACALGMPVDAITQDGGGASGTRRALADAMRKDPGRLVGKLVVVWQFSTRELSSGEWPLIALPQTTSITPTIATVDRVTGTVLSVAAAPRPGTTPYRDALVAVVVGLPSDQKILVYAWGLRDDRPSEPSQLAPGDIVTIDRRPWAAVDHTISSIQRIEPIDDADLLLEPWFAERIVKP